ncbi:hypothetical protein B1H29_06605 [Streptomyces pactum]|uniref:Uncharacterized protein n=1 Tax=Streptomyces pactum TaxID=68249 RepID=A0A1S6J4E2_9ACTN|nr:hypothetical protein B1H29_06605 [Streptomyces pactum]
MRFAPLRAPLRAALFFGRLLTGPLAGRLVLLVALVLVLRALAVVLRVLRGLGVTGVAGSGARRPGRHAGELVAHLGGTPVQAVGERVDLPLDHGARGRLAHAPQIGA